MKYATLDAQGEWLDRRKRELGLDGDSYVAPNSGRRRSPGKRALLRKLDEIKAESPRALAFQANYHAASPSL